MKCLVIGNWKMNPPTLKEAKVLFSATKRAVARVRSVTVVVCPPALYLQTLSEGVRKGRLSLGVQNAHFEPGGAHTGDISMQQAHDSKAAYVIIGHAERRELGETNDDTRKKVAAALSVGLTPVLCVGEREREGGAEHLNFVREQLRVGLADVDKKLLKVVIVYEPLWTIGKTTAMQPRDMHEMSIFIKKTLVEKFGDVGHSATILYGGSVDASNAGAMMRDGDVKGLLVGRASTNAATFTDLLEAINEA